MKIKQMSLRSRKIALESLIKDARERQFNLEVLGTYNAELNHVNHEIEVEKEHRRLKIAELKNIV